MKVNDAIEQTKQELLIKYKDAVYKGYEVVDMTSNVTTSSYIKEQIDIDVIDVVPIRDRFNEVKGKIRAIKAVFDVKRPRKRKYERYETYYKIIE